MSHVPLQVLAQQTRAIEEFRNSSKVWDALPNIKPNRLAFMHGVQDKVIPVRNSVLAASRVPGSWLITSADTGHGWMFSRTQLFS